MGYYFYFLFYNAYWASVDIGRRGNPRQNANYYMVINMLFFFSGLSFAASKLAIQVDLKWVVIVAVVIVLLLEQRFLSKREFDLKFKDYEFISGFSKRKRLTIFWSVFIVTGTVNLVGAFLFSGNFT